MARSRFMALLVALLSVPMAGAIGSMDAEEETPAAPAQVLAWASLPRLEDFPVVFKPMMRAPVELAAFFSSEIGDSDNGSGQLVILLAVEGAADPAPRVFDAAEGPRILRVNESITVSSIDDSGTIYNLVHRTSPSETPALAGSEPGGPTGGANPDLAKELAIRVGAGDQVFLVPYQAPMACPAGPTSAVTTCTGRPTSRKREASADRFPSAAIDWPVLLGFLLVASVLLALVGTAWGLLGPLFTRFVRSDVLDHPRRTRIYDCVTAQPGLLFGEIAQLLEIPNGALQHHLGLLQHQGLIVRYRDGRSTRFYPSGPRVPTSATLSSTRERILGSIAAGGRMTASEVALCLGHRVQSVWHHLRRLESAGLLTGHREGRVIFWRVAGA